MSNTKKFISVFTHLYIAKPLIWLGDLIKSYIRLLFPKVQQEVATITAEELTKQGFEEWRARLASQPSIKPFLVTPGHHSDKQARKGGKFTKNK